MSIAEIRARIKQAIGRISGIDVECIDDNERFDAMELDSLSRIELLVELEREFQLDIPEDQEDENLVQSIQSVEDAVQYVLHNLVATEAA